MSAVNPFANCRDYRGEKDDKYVQCLANTSGDPCTLIRDLHRAKEFRTYFLAIIPFVLSVVCIVINLLFIYLAYLHVLRRRRSSKKRYTFLINRSISAVIAQILLYIVLITWKARKLQYSSAAMFLLVGGLSILIYSGTYLIVTPLWYKQKVTIQLCLWIIAIIWVLSVGFSIMFGLLGATLFYPESAPIHCEYYRCQFPMSIRLKNASISDQRGQQEGNTQERLVTHERNVRTLNRLSMNLIAFAVSKLPLLIVATVALSNLHDLTSHLGFGDKAPCKTFSNASLFYQVEILASIAAILWLLGMSVDPLISIGSDPIFMEDLKKRYKCLRMYMGRVCSSHKSPRVPLTREPTVTEELNSGEF
ncbi:G-PROTEIN-RECEP-F1-2 domain-containing protein [Aphelenchoides fujianensis]|nr:G-PROTEIN-RECEP-F1-2 domain-containing protein [Aphelenchoides fujianensis]